MKATKTIITMLFALLLAACSAPRQATSAGAPPPLLPQKEQVWQLVRLQGRPLPPRQPVTTLVVNPDAGTADGQAACNTYSFSCTLGHPDQHLDADYYDIRLSPIGSGSVGCSEADMNAEQRYLAALGRATRLRLTATTLTLYQKDREILYFELQ